MIVIGVDGMDPGFVERHWSDLPNLARLRDRGGFQRLRTTMPPQSPVAWSSFITGREPAGHGIFDFVERDPRTMQPFSSMSRIREPRFQIPLGPYLLPLTPAHFETLRQGTPFWRLLADQNIPVVIEHMPVNFPPEKAGEAIAGMGVPDLRGTEGTFTFFTSDPGEPAREVPGGRIVAARQEGGKYVLPVEGPPNPLRKDHRFSSVDLIVEADPERDVAMLRIGQAMAIVQTGEWSDWLPVDFPLLGRLAQAHGMVRLYAKALHPWLQLYVSPVNVDPRRPELPVSTPSSYGRRAAQVLGPYYTQGIAEDTAALRQGVFSLEQFLGQAALVRADELKLFRFALDHFDHGLLFFYFSAVDQTSHMLWGKHEPQLLEVYRAIDAALGEAARRFPRADLVVMSDHGFNSFDRAVNLNTWLWEKGFLALTRAPHGGDENFAGVDWTKTQVYAIGLNGLYLNLAGREKHGIVKPGAEAAAVRTRLVRALLEFNDPVTGRQVVETAPATAAPSGPDLIVGYAPGYRASWETALGATPRAILEDNNDAWIGDHCINAADVPGVLASNRSPKLEDPSLEDLTVTILRAFGVRPDTAMKGRNLF